MEKVLWFMGLHPCALVDRAFHVEALLFHLHPRPRTAPADRQEGALHPGVSPNGSGRTERGVKFL